MSTINTRHTQIETLLGEVTVVAADEAIVGVYFRNHWYRPGAETFGPRVEVSDDPLLREAGQQIDDYLSGARSDFDLRTATNGDPFQERVWPLLRRIPRGQTVTYGELAAQLGDRSLAQAVGQAVGHNPLSVIVACHRVVGVGGKLTGYAGGLEKKRFLLELEEPERAVTGRLL
jgi:methylated-DNA-[protein]-cysteine S-methyltransferase